MSSKLRSKICLWTIVILLAMMSYNCGEINIISSIEKAHREIVQEKQQEPRKEDTLIPLEISIEPQKIEVPEEAPEVQAPDANTLETSESATEQHPPEPIIPEQTTEKPPAPKNVSLWSKSEIFWSNDSTGIKILVDTKGNVILLNKFCHIVFVGNTKLKPDAECESFIAKMDPKGKWLWAKRAYGRGFTLDTMDNIYITGAFKKKGVFGAMTLTTKATSAFFVAKMDTNGKWLWARKAADLAEGQAITMDTQGSFYITGAYEQKAVFGSITLSTKSPVSHTVDLFVAKMDTNGKWLWASSAWSDSIYSSGIVVNTKGESIIVGTFHHYVYFENKSVQLTGSSSAFLAKLDSKGKWIWFVHQFGERDQLFASSGSGNSIKIDAKDNIYATGHYYYPSGFSWSFLWKYNSSGKRLLYKKFQAKEGNDLAIDKNGNIALTGYINSNSRLGNTSLLLKGEQDAFIAKMDAKGKWLWAKKGGGNSPSTSRGDEGNSVAFDAKGNLYVLGSFDRTADFGTTQLTANGVHSVFVSHLDTNGKWLWTKGVTSKRKLHNVVKDVTVDTRDNVYVIGNFHGKNSYVFNRISLTARGAQDIFVTKLDKEGQWLWTKHVGGISEYDAGQGIFVNSKRQVYITGTFGGTIKLGPYTLTSKGPQSIFIAKLDNTGNWLWAKNLGKVSPNSNSDFSLDSQNNIYVTGQFEGIAKFGAKTLTARGTRDIFVAKLDGSGNWLWSQRAGSKNGALSKSINASRKGHLFITGSFSGSADFGTTTLSAKGQMDVFVAKLDTSGRWLWAKQAGAPSAEVMGLDAAVDSQENVIVTGYFTKRATFGTNTISSKGGKDLFLAKLSTNGKWLWSKTAGGPANDSSNGITTNTQGEIYITGSFEQKALFGSRTLTANGGSDVFVAKLDTSGKWLWAKRDGSRLNDEGETITHAKKGYLVVCGHFEGRAYFGKTPHSDIEKSNLFVWKLAD